MIHTLVWLRRKCCLIFVMFTIVPAFCAAQSDELILVNAETVRSSDIEFGTTEYNCRTSFHKLNRTIGTHPKPNFEFSVDSAFNCAYFLYPIWIRGKILEIVAWERIKDSQVFLAQRARLSRDKFVRIYRVRVPNKQTPFIVMNFLL